MSKGASAVQSPNLYLPQRRRVHRSSQYSFNENSFSRVLGASVVKDIRSLFITETSRTIGTFGTNGTRAAYLRGEPDKSLKNL